MARKKKFKHTPMRKSHPNVEAVAEYHARVRTFGEDIPPTLKVTIARAFGPDAIPRAEVLRKLNQGRYTQSVSNFLHVVLRKGKFSVVKMFFSEEQFFFIQEDLVRKVYLKSIVYKSRQIALMEFHKGTVYYIERGSLE